MKKSGRLNLILPVLLTTLFVNACNSTPVNQLSKAHDNSQVFSDSQTAFSGTSKSSMKNHVRSKTFIKGIAEFPTKSKLDTKAIFSDITASATVSIINPDTNETIATGISDQSGAFSINPDSSFIPSENEFFILEGSKRNGGIGSTLMSVRTLIQWSGGHWAGITSPIIKINTKTTALAVIYYLNNSISPDILINSLDSDNGNFILVDESVTTPVFEEVTTLVTDVLTGNGDPLKQIGFINNEYYLKAMSNIVGLTASEDVFLYNLYSSTADLRMVNLNGTNDFLIDKEAYNGILSADRKRVIYGKEICPSECITKVYSSLLNGEGKIDLAGDLPGSVSRFGYSSNLKKYWFVMYEEGNGLSVYVTDGTIENRIKVSDTTLDGIDQLNTNDGNGYHTWSKDNSKFMLKGYAFSSPSNLFLFYADGSKPMVKLNKNIALTDRSSEVGRFSDNGNRVVMETGDSDHTNLYVVSANETGYSDPVIISNKPGMGSQNELQRILFSPDSSKLAWVSFNNSNVTYTIYVINSDGSGNAVNIGGNFTFDSVYGLKWSPNSSKLAFVGNTINDTRDDIYVSDLSANNALNTSSSLSAPNRQPNFSANSSKIFFNNEPSGVNIYSVNAVSPFTPSLLAPDSAFGYDLPDNPNGQLFLFSSNTGIKTLSSDGNTITDMGNISLQHPEWTSDGSKLFFNDDNFDYWVINSDGSNLTKITNTPGPQKSGKIFLK